jgi:hypothetical protein
LLVLFDFKVPRFDIGLCFDEGLYLCKCFATLKLDL